MPFTFTSRIVSNVVVIDLSGRFTANDNSLRDLVASTLAEGRKQFLFNLADVPFLGTWGISQIVTIWASVRRKDGEVALVGPTQVVRDVLKITSLSKIFPIYDSEPEALKHFSE